MNQSSPSLSAINSDPEFLTVGEAARFVRLSARTLARLAEVGEGPPRLQLTERRIVYLKSDLLAWAESRVIAPHRAHCEATITPIRRSSFSEARC